MLKKSNKRLSASDVLHASHKGFSLPELIIAVVIIGIASGVVLHAFLTSATLTNKATKLNEASDAAQNIQEIIEAFSAEDFLGGNEDVLDYLGISVDDYSCEDEEKTVTLRNLSSGNSTFDAKVRFSTGNARTVNGEVDLSSADGFFLINNKKISNYAAQKATYQQGISSNPDLDADRSFNQSYGLSCKGITGKSREIVINITPELNEDGTPKNTFTVNGEYRYTYNYNENVDNTGIAPLILPAAPKTISTYVHAQSVNGSTSIELNEDGSYTTVFFGYWPMYTDTTAREKNSTFEETITVNNIYDLPVRLVLVKQKPMILNDEGTAYEAMDDTLLNLCENKYIVKIYEYHSKEFIDSNYVLTADSRTKTLLTNAKLNISSVGGYIASFTYKMRGTGGTELNYEEVIKDNSLVNSEKLNRLYDVTIEIFDPGKVEEEGSEPFATFNGNKLV